VTEKDALRMPPDAPHSPGTPEPPTLDVDIQRFQDQPDFPENGDVNPDAGASEPPD
jgi:hypothetical protein